MTGQAVARVNGMPPDVPVPAACKAERVMRSQDVPAVADVAGTGESVNADTGIELSAWLRQQREARSWSRRELARQLIKAGREAGDTAIPGIESLCHNVHRWEHGINGLTERYILYYCKAFDIPAGQFSRDTPVAEPPSHAATINVHDLSIALHHAPGRLVIEISGLNTAEEREPEPDSVLALVTSQQPRRGTTADEHKEALGGNGRKAYRPGRPALTLTDVSAWRGLS